MAKVKKIDKEKLRAEIVRCGRDPVYFSRYAKIKHPTRGLIPFKLWDFQEQLLRDYLEHRYNIVLKARQLGATEDTALFISWLVVFHRDKNVLCIATKAETAKTIIKRVRTIIKHLPKWLMITQITTDNVMSLEFANGSIVKAIASSEDAGRSESVSLLVVDEAAHIKNLDEMWMGLLPTVSAGGRVIVLSTPNGVGNVFHKLFSEAEKGVNDFYPTKLPWWVHPEHIEGLRDDPERPGFKISPWFVKETSGMSSRERAQEHELDFLSSGETFLSSTGLQYVEDSIIPPVYIEGRDAGLHIWSRPTSSTRRYFLCADTARGDASDCSAFHIFDVEDVEQQAEYNGRIPVDDFARLICETGWSYNRCPVVVENNSLGLAVLQEMRNWQCPDGSGKGYPNVYCTVRRESEKGECIDLRHVEIPDKLVLGLTTSGKTRPLILNKLEEYIRTHTMRIHSRRTKSEMETFVWTNGRPEAAPGKTDDLVMALAFGAWARETCFAPGLNSGEMNKALLASSQLSVRSNTQIHGASKNPDLSPSRGMGAFYRPQDPYRLQVGRMVVNLRELLDRRR